MTYILIGLVVAVAIFVAGFFVGMKHGQCAEAAATGIKNAVDKF